ncbi:hypothetical protein [Microbacterium sp.]|uniref:lipopolysaccharide biosynthesis protein n=1 Tax=Microbacterium sp. TaxID=51671 RepID=UPI0025F1DFC0|nr:hypothetical protein [Microbacterium sp.]
MLRTYLSLGLASAWMVVGRLAGLGWTLFLVASLGVADYGQYATAYAVAAILSAPIENIFVVRVVRIGDEDFRAERSMRALLGAGLVAAGLSVYAWSFIAGFALAVAGFEMLFNAYKSVALRGGRPGRIMRMDAARQLSSIALAVAAYGMLGDAATLELICLAYLSPYLVVLLLAAKQAWGAAPRWPRGLRAQAVLVVDALVLSVYLQGDILLLGLLFDQEVVGVYSIVSQLALAASTIGQLFGQQYAERLRENDGHHTAGAPMRLTVILGIVLSVGAGVLAVALCLFPEYRSVGIVLAVIAPFAGLRAITNTWVTALYVRGVDGARVSWSALALVVRFGLILSMVAFGVSGAVAAAAAAGFAELILVFAYYRLVLRPLYADRGGASGTG